MVKSGNPLRPREGNLWGETAACACQGAAAAPGFLRVFRLLRFFTLVFTSAVYLSGSYPGEVNIKLLLVLALLALSLLLVKAYSQYGESVNAVKVLTLLECLGILLLLLFTGGLAGPYVWYVLNPLFIAAMCLPLLYPWALLGFFLCWGMVQEFYLLQGGFSLLGVLRTQLELVLLLGLFTLAMGVFARLYHKLAEKSQQLEMQQREFAPSLAELGQSQYVLQALSEFQRTVVSLKGEGDVLKRLAEENVFALFFQETAILYLDEPLFPDSSHPFGGFRLLQGSDGMNMFLGQEVILRVRDRWQEFYTERGFITGTEGNWIAVPVRVDKEKLVAVLLGQLKACTNLDKTLEYLYPFLQFAEQAIQSLESVMQARETVSQFCSFYAAVETISSRENIREIMDLLGAYARKVTDSEKVVFWMEQAGEGEFQHRFVYSVKGKRDFFPEECWRGALLRAWAEIRENSVPVVYTLEEGVTGHMICMPVKSRSRCLGVLAALQSRKRYNMEEILQKLTFLSELSAIIIERNMAGLFSDKLLVLEEQNRIANEIHDNISQNLFSIVYGLQSIKQTGKLAPGLQEQLAAIQGLAARTARELRFMIYRLSPRHRGDDTFMAEVRGYLNGLAKINNTVINFNVEGMEHFLNSFMRKAIYRMIREATGNAIRHGKCGKIEIGLKMSPSFCELKIDDDGKGFDPAAGDKHRQGGGLGITNMRELANSLQGDFDIQSAPGQGTVVYCWVPKSPDPGERAISSG